MNETLLVDRIHVIQNSQVFGSPHLSIYLACGPKSFSVALAKFLLIQVATPLGVCWVIGPEEDEDEEEEEEEVELDPFLGSSTPAKRRRVS